MLGFLGDVNLESAPT